MFKKLFQSKLNRNSKFEIRNLLRGMTLVEVVIASAVITLVFGGLFVSFQLMISLIGVAKAETGAIALANERIEYIRSLPYDDVGTVGGIPEGTIPQNTTRILNGVSYNERVLIEYVDAPEDGEGASDENGILADYKLVKIEYTWDQKGTERTRSLLSNIVPRGIETTAGGGTLRVNVFDADVLPIDGAEVRVYNTTGTSTIDTIRYTNASGTAMFSGAPALASYEITVTKDGYSTDGTYGTTAGNPNPNPPHVAVIESEVSTMNFQIDLLGSVSVATVGVPVTDEFSDTFSDGNGITASENITVSSGAAALSGAPGTYVGSGTLRSVAIAPTLFTSWESFSFDVATSSNTEVVMQLYAVTGTSTIALVPDSALPGNSAGFTVGPVDVSTLDTATYPSLALFATLTSSDVLETPLLASWGLSYTVSEPPIADVPFTFTSQKSIGTTASATPVYKFSNAYTTDTSGLIDIPDLEWDLYDVSLDTASYDIAEACPGVPLEIAPGTSMDLKLTLDAAAARSLRVAIVDTDGVAVTGATAHLTRTGVDASIQSSSCGQAFFNDALPSATDYTLEISKTGYVTETVTDLEITGTETVSITLGAL